MAATLEASPIGGPDIGVKIGVTEPVLLPSSLPDSITADKSRSAEGGRFLVSSPYPFPPHLLDLSALTASQSLLAEALGSMEAVRPDYATAPYDAAFNWDTVMDKLRSLASTRNFQWPHQYFYIVVFRSRIPDTSVRAELGRLDEKSHTEANQSGGLLKYWFGVPDAEGRNLATCIWRQASDARPGSSGAGHKAATRATMSLYTEWRVERLKLTIEDGARGWKIEDWVN